MPKQAEVLVVGAGPVGLMMASELHRHGVTCRLIEKLPEPSGHCKALGITPRTLEVFDDIGIVNDALEAGLPLKGLINIANGDMQMSDESSVALTEGAYGFLTLAQYDVERILTSHLHGMGGAIERQTELVSYEQDSQAIRATLKLPDGSTETSTFRYMIGCDGGRSAVRHGLDVRFEGDHYEQVFMLADVELDWDLPRGYGYKMIRIEDGQMRGAAACIPVPGNPNRYRFSTNAPDDLVPSGLSSAGQPTHGISPVGPTLEQISEVFAWLFQPGITMSNLRWSAFYRISHRIVSHYRKGCVFLVGDAAHLHPPLGGQGMNTGLQDAYNLGWKLALELRGHASPTLLDSYEAERRPIGLEIVERTTKRMNDVLEGVFDELEPVREDSQLFQSYRPSGWVTEGPGLESAFLRGGDRAPDVTGLRRPYARYECRLFDLRRGRAHLLLLYTNHSNTAADCQSFRAISQAIKDRFGSSIKVYAILHPDCPLPAVEGLSILVDGRNELAQLYTPKRGSAFVIRPDGYLGHRSASVTLEGLSGYFRRVLKGE